MAYIEVEVDLDAFSNDEIVSEVIYRINGNYLKIKQKREIIDTLKVSSTDFDISTLADEMKLAYIKKIFHKYSLEEFERGLPC